MLSQFGVKGTNFVFRRVVKVVTGVLLSIGLSLWTGRISGSDVKHGVGHISEWWGRGW
jgi:hypothetical protein